MFRSSSVRYGSFSARENFRAIILGIGSDRISIWVTFARSNSNSDEHQRDAGNEAAKVEAMDQVGVNLLQKMSLVWVLF